MSSLPATKNPVIDRVIVKWRD